MSDDVLITPASRKVEFFDNGGNIDGKIELDSNGNLNITSTGSIAIGDITQDIHVGDGTQAVDLVFDFSSSIYSVANQSLTIGKKSLGGNEVIIDTPTNLTVNTDSGNIDIGPRNTSFCHIRTDRSKFYFSKPLIIDGGDTNGDAYLISAYNTEDFVIATNNGTEDRITVKQATGNVGIGTTSPGHLLEVAGGGANGEIVVNRTSGAEILLQAQSATGVIGTSTNHDLAIKTNGSTRMQIENGGNVGIGTTSPEALLDVNTGSGIAIQMGADVNATTLTNDTRKYGRFATPHYHNAEEPIGLVVGDSDGTDNIVNIGGGSNAVNAATNIRFWTAANDATLTGTEQMRITSAGNTEFTGNVVSTSQSSYNIMAHYYFQRTSMGTGVVDLRVPVGGDGTANPNFYAMPRAGKVMAFTINYYGGSITTTSGTDTFRIRKFSNNVESTTDVSVARTSLTNIQGNSHTRTIELSSPITFAANDGIYLKRQTSGGNVIHVSAILYVAFDA